MQIRRGKEVRSCSSLISSTTQLILTLSFTIVDQRLFFFPNVCCSVMLTTLFFLLLLPTAAQFDLKPAMQTGNFITIFFCFLPF